MRARAAGARRSGRGDSATSPAVPTGVPRVACPPVLSPRKGTRAACPPVAPRHRRQPPSEPYDSHGRANRAGPAAGTPRGFPPAGLARPARCVNLIRTAQLPPPGVGPTPGAPPRDARHAPPGPPLRRRRRAPDGRPRRRADDLHLEHRVRGPDVAGPRELDRRRVGRGHLPGAVRQRDAGQRHRHRRGRDRRARLQLLPGAEHRHGRGRRPTVPRGDPVHRHRHQRRPLDRQRVRHPGAAPAQRDDGRRHPERAPGRHRHVGPAGLRRLGDGDRARDRRRGDPRQRGPDDQRLQQHLGGGRRLGTHRPGRRHG